MSERAALVDEFFLVSGTDNLPFSTSSVVQFGAAVFGSLLAFVLVWIFGNPS